MLLPLPTFSAKKQNGKRMCDAGSGTYIRSIGYRLGQQLGLGGALIELKRTSIGPRNLEDI